MAWFQHNNSQIYYEEDGSGDPVLLLPGFSASGEQYSALRQALSAHYRVITADLPGSGQSGPQPRTYTATYYEEDARLFIDFLQQMGIDSAHLIGHSDGGEVALLMATFKPDIARSVVVWGSSAALTESHLPMTMAFNTIIDNPAAGFEGFREYLVASYGEDNARAMTQSFSQAMKAIITERGGDISISRVSHITAPVLVIAGEHDFIVTHELAADLAGRIPNATLIEVEGAGHNLHDERPEWMAQTILDWLAK